MKKKAAGEIRKWQRYHFFGSASVRVARSKAPIEAMIANISLSGIGLYSSKPIGKGKKAAMTIAFLDKDGKILKDSITGKVDWQKKFRNIYLAGILFDEEPNVLSQPKLMEHLTWLIDTYDLPQPFRDKRIAML
ncbi:MAG: PilZ domain-containing protein [Nitrospirota bacterium]